MNGDLLLNIVLVFVFVLVGGVFAATEMALVTLRESQINAIAARGKRGEKVAGLARNPNTFLSAVQIGVTVAGFASAAYGASSIAPSVTPLLVGSGSATRPPHDRDDRPHARHRVPVARARRARAQAARHPAQRPVRVRRRARARRVRHAHAPGDLAAVGLDERASCACSAATRTRRPTR